MKLTYWFKAKSMICLLTLSLFSSFFISSQSSAQEGSQLIPLSEEEAMNEIASRRAAFGFSQVYFDKVVLSSLAMQEDVTSFRFYTAIPSDMAGNLGNPTALVVAVNSFGQEVGNYVRIDGISPSFLVREQALSDVQNSFNSESSTVATTLGLGTVQNIIGQNGATGLHLRPGNGGNGDTFIFVSAMTNGSGSSDVGGNYGRHASPCPPACEDGFLMDLK